MNEKKLAYIRDCIGWLLCLLKEKMMEQKYIILFGLGESGTYEGVPIKGVCSGRKNENCNNFIYI